jgi:hypothetical protein
MGVKECDLLSLSIKRNNYFSDGNGDLDPESATAGRNNLSMPLV